MSDPATKRRWFSFSLRTLFVVVAVIGTIAGAMVHLLRRAEYLRERQQYHFMQWAIATDEFWKLNVIPSRDANQDALLQEWNAKIIRHIELSLEIDHAIWRPWVSVDEESTH